MWKPWNTAPRDRRFLAAYMASAGPRVTEAEYEHNRFRAALIGFLAIEDRDALGWMELPKPPTAAVV